MNTQNYNFRTTADVLISSAETIAPSISRYAQDKNYGNVTDEELKMDDYTRWIIEVRVFFNRLASIGNPEFRELEKEYRSLVANSKNFHSKSILVHQLKTLLMTARQFLNIEPILKDFGGSEIRNLPYEKYLVDIFISHSNRDKDIAEKLVEILRSSLNLNVDQIRCTSVDGYKLPGGTKTKDQLRIEIHTSIILIGIITESSLGSAYVLFELGARWGTEKPMIPVLAKGTKPNSLKGPLESINCLSCDNSAEVHQLIEQVADELKIKKQNTASYNSKIDGLVKYSREMGNNTK